MLYSTSSHRPGHPIPYSQRRLSSSLIDDNGVVSGLAKMTAAAERSKLADRSLPMCSCPLMAAWWQVLGVLCSSLPLSVF